MMHWQSWLLPKIIAVAGASVSPMRANWLSRSCTTTWHLWGSRSNRFCSN